MHDNFTDRTKRVMQLANQEAQRFNHKYIGTAHILLGLVKEGSGIGGTVLLNLGLTLRKIRLEVEKIIQSGPEMVTMGKLPQTRCAKKVIERAMEEARNLQHNYVGTEHLLLSLIGDDEGAASQVLKALGATAAAIREAVMQIIGTESPPTDNDKPLEPAIILDSSHVVWAPTRPLHRSLEVSTDDLPEGWTMEISQPLKPQYAIAPVIADLMRDTAEVITTCLQPDGGWLVPPDKTVQLKTGGTAWAALSGPIATNDLMYSIRHMRFRPGSNADRQQAEEEFRSSIWDITGGLREGLQLSPNITADDIRAAMKLLKLQPRESA